MMTLKKETEVITFFKDIRIVTSKSKPLSVTTVLSIAEIIVKKKFPFSSLGIRIFPHANHLTSAHRASMVYANDALITQDVYLPKMNDSLPMRQLLTFPTCLAVVQAK